MKKLDCIRLVKSILDDHNIVFWLDYGSLLGAVREKDFLIWDNEFDFSIFRSDYDRLMELIPVFCSNGFRLLHAHSSDSLQFMCEGFKIDFNIYRRDGDVFVRYWNIHKKSMVGRFLDGLIKRLYSVYLRRYSKRYRSCIPVNYFSSFKKITFFGDTWRVPSNMVGYLRLHYGKDWTVPKKDYDFIRDDGTVEEVWL